MHKLLDEYLCKKYPKIFRDRRAPMTQTCMCWGIECGEGWYNIIHALCAVIKGALTDCSFDIRFTQIKEKFGTLRVYYRAEDKSGERMDADSEVMSLGEISGAVRMAEYLSCVTCEVCGKPGKTRGGDWIATLCKEHEAKRKEVKEN